MFAWLFQRFQPQPQPPYSPGTQQSGQSQPPPPQQTGQSQSPPTYPYAGHNQQPPYPMSRLIKCQYIDPRWLLLVLNFQLGGFAEMLEGVGSNVDLSRMLASNIGLKDEKDLCHVQVTNIHHSSSLVSASWSLAPLARPG
ncbi:hypothetical protein DVH24_003582 [Malus domestica]|uniref:Uncharacterized protein n=1 Tax=Malus domestica TaxID=3750 RepID=A0A498ILP3_MALDO|nr:hypothetical protein DVH24_003582 [Malus domestica]